MSERPELARIALLTLASGFAGGMVGLERTVLPLAARDLGVASTAGAVAFIALFGAAKAYGDLIADPVAERWGGRRLLLAAWLLGFPVPFALALAPSWPWILVANVLLGLHLALVWSAGATMRERGASPRPHRPAGGLDDSAVYAGMAAMALLTGVAAARPGTSRDDLFLGGGVALLGLELSILVLLPRIPLGGRAREQERSSPGAAASPELSEEGGGRRLESGRAPRPEGEPERLSLGEVFRRSAWADRSLSTASLAGLATAFKDGMLWGLLPLLLTGRGLGIGSIGVVVALYLAAWSAAQRLFGRVSDRAGRKATIVGGMVLQALGVWFFVLFGSTGGHLAAAALAGLGTAMTRPALLALVADAARAGWRATALAAHRFWSDLGYVPGALAMGYAADRLGLRIAILIGAALVLVAARVAASRLPTGLPPAGPTLEPAHRFRIPTRPRDEGSGEAGAGRRARGGAAPP